MTNVNTSVMKKKSSTPEVIVLVMMMIMTIKTITVNLYIYILLSVDIKSTGNILSTSLTNIKKLSFVKSEVIDIDEDKGNLFHVILSNYRSN